MVEYEHLRTASLYINNQLLSRGLLRDGQTIDFSDPSRCDGGTSETMGKIMGVVNDLILRRDRDAEHRESLSTTLRTVRADSLRQTNDLSRLLERQADTQRRLASAETSENTTRTQLRTAESAIRGLKEEMARARTMVAQTRASCANEVRKRERQIEALKKHVAEAGRTRGVSRSHAVTTISVTGEFAGEEHQREGDENTGDDYDLRGETNEFLTELAKGLSAENEVLLHLVRQTLERLRGMGGLPEDEAMSPKKAAALSVGDGGNAPLVHNYESNCQELETELESILGHLHTILSNPSFVPIEEVEVREEEIHRLRDGWEKMETRWKEAVHLIDGWRRRMVSHGKGVNMEELKMGLRLSPVRVRDVAETSQGLGIFALDAVKEEDEEEDEEAYEENLLLRSPCPAETIDFVPIPVQIEDEVDDGDVGDSDSDSSSIFQDDVHFGDLEADEPNVEILEQSIAFEEPVAYSARPLPALVESDAAGNRGSSESTNIKIENPTEDRERPGDFSAIIEENTLEIAEASMPPPPPPQPKPVAKKEPVAARPQQKRQPRPASRVTRAASPPFASSKTSAPSTTADPPRRTRPAVTASRPTERTRPAARTRQPVSKVQPSSKPPAAATRTIAAAAGRTRTRPAAAAKTNTRPTPSPTTSRPTSAKETTQQTTATEPQSRPISRATTIRSITPIETQQPSPQRQHQVVSSASNHNEVDNDDEDELSRPRPPSASTSSATTTATTGSSASVASHSTATNPASSTSTAGAVRTPGRPTSPFKKPAAAASAGNGSSTATVNGTGATAATPSASSRLPLPANPPPQQSPLSMATIAAKLAASEREADAARVRAKLRAARRGGRKALGPTSDVGGKKETVKKVGSPQDGQRDVSNGSNGSASTVGGGVSVNEQERAPEPLGQDVNLGDPVKKGSLNSSTGLGISVGAVGSGSDREGVMAVEKPRKRERRASKVANRRRSTLSPWEMQSLIRGGVGSPSK